MCAHLDSLRLSAYREFGGKAPDATGTSISGNYSFSDTPPGTYTITPTKSGVTFNPGTQTVTVGSSDVTGVNFIGVTPAYIIGRVTDGSGQGIGGVTITRSGGGQATFTVQTTATVSTTTNARV